MNSLLLWIGGLLVAVLALLFAAPYAIDWNAYRGVFEEEASRILGRDVRVGGEVNLRLLPAPYVRFEKVRISDAGALLGEPFFRTEAFTLWLSPAPLLRGTIEASDVELDRPVLRLAVDQEGRGNWQEIKISPGALPFVPNDVILQQVKVRQGIVSLRTPGVAEPLTLANIDGELAASSLDGPYRFRGLVDWLGARRELRIGTSQREPDGTLRYKASVRSPDNDNVYAIDGMLSELSPRGRHIGTLTAKLPLANVFGGLMPSDGARPLRGHETIDLTAKLEGDLEGARLTDLAFAFEHDGKPQLVSGELSANWRQGLRVETRLASRWLDLDQIVGQEGRKAPPIDMVRRLIGQASALLPRDGTSLVTFDIDQVNLGGEALSGVRLALARAGGLTSIGEFRAALPGNAHGSLRGTLGSNAPADTRAAAPSQRSAGMIDTFDGEIVLHGPGYQRFAAWAGAEGLFATPPSADPQARPDAPFSIASRLKLDADGVTLTNAQIELGTTRVVASADWRWGATRQLDISAEGRKIDIAPIAPGSLDLTRSTRDATPGNNVALAETGSVPLVELAARMAAVDRAVGALRLKLRAQTLTDGQVSLDDVDADLEMKGGTASITALTATTTAGARLDLKGRIGGLTAKPAGTLRGWASAATSPGVQSMIAALPPAAQTAAAPWLASTTRADLGFTLTLGGAQQDLVTLAANGAVDGARTAIDLKLDGGLARWREAPVRLSLDLDGAAAARPLRLLMGQPAAEAARAPTEGTTVSVQAAGATAGAILVTARAEAGRAAGAANADFDGKAALLPDGDIELNGSLRLDAAAADDMIALAGGPRRSIGAQTAVRGVVDLTRKAGTTTLSARSLDVAGARVGGTLTLARKNDKTRLDGQITTERLEIAGLLGLLLDARSKPVEAGEATASPWPETAFAAGLVEGVEGLVVINAATARLTPELSLSDAEARIAFSPGRVELQGLGGAALGGRFSARGSIERAPAGAEVSLETRLTGVQLAQITPRAAKPSSGEANVVLSMTSRGLSPRAVMSTANGRGEIEIRNGRIPGLGAELVEKAAAAAIEASEAIDHVHLERLILAERGRSGLTLGNRKLAVEIADGAARIATLEISQPEATLRNMTTVDLAQLKADSEWQIVSRRPLPGSGRATRREPLPALGLVWTGPLATVARQEPRLSVEALERELTIRKLERDAEKLEELRRQDENRMRQELERRRTENQGTSAQAGRPGSAPVIQVPLPIPPQAAPQPATPPPPRVVRPPTSPRAREQRTLQELMMGQQP